MPSHPKSGHCSPQTWYKIKIYRIFSKSQDKSTATKQIGSKPQNQKTYAQIQIKKQLKTQLYTHPYMIYPLTHTTTYICMYMYVVSNFIYTTINQQRTSTIVTCNRGMIKCNTLYYIVYTLYIYIQLYQLQYNVIIIYVHIYLIVLIVIQCNNNICTYISNCINCNTMQQQYMYIYMQYHIHVCNTMYITLKFNFLTTLSFIQKATMF
eukprot:TRINITY_DN32140_c0_g1_i2.p2 TRINITY_DN32140_c0_g1~~TRINITY_DN32140_c0_g1_i2.p2  ORF type:complete len:208 (-),score=-38.45 TRINITY_DN32140_c0_g1_i2:214-837(-)